VWRDWLRPKRGRHIVLAFVAAENPSPSLAAVVTLLNRRRRGRGTVSALLSVHHALFVPRRLAPGELTRRNGLGGA